VTDWIHTAVIRQESITAVRGGTPASGMAE